MGLTGRQTRALRRRCEEIVVDLTIPEPFDIEVLCEAIGERRGRRLRVAPYPLATGRGSPCGMWVSMKDEDIIMIEQRTSSLHQQHIGLHEIGHILCDHGANSSLGLESAVRLMPNLDPEMVQRVLSRSSYDFPQEQEAEMIASLLGERIGVRSHGRRRATRTSDQSQTGVALRKLTEAFGGTDH